MWELLSNADVKSFLQMAMWKSFSKCFCEYYLACAHVNIILQVTMWKSFFEMSVWSSFCKCLYEMHFYANVQTILEIWMPKSFSKCPWMWKSVWNKSLWRSFCNCQHENHFGNASIKIIRKCLCETHFLNASVKCILQMPMCKLFYKCLCKQYFSNASLKIILQVCSCESYFSNANVKIILKMLMWKLFWQKNKQTSTSQVSDSKNRNKIFKQLQKVRG